MQEVPVEYEQITRDIRVTVLPCPLAENSDVSNNVYAFAYTITLENLGSETVQLLERHWIISSAGERSSEVIGLGVVGENPVLSKGEIFQYTSGAVIDNPIGAMEGSYTFRTDLGTIFQVSIPKFTLIYEDVLN